MAYITDNLIRENVTTPASIQLSQRMLMTRATRVRELLLIVV